MTIDFQFKVSFHYSVTSVSDYFCFSMGAIVGSFHLSLFLELVFTFFHLFQNTLLPYGGDISGLSSEN